MVPSAGSYGAIRFAPAAAAKITSNIRNAPRASLFAQSWRAALRMRDARVEPRVQRVGHEGDGGDHGGDEKGRALHDRVVAHEDRLDQQPADTGPVEDRLRDDRSAQQ